MQQIAVLDYGMGNLRSVSKALEHAAPNHSIVVTSDQSVIEQSDKIVCPGQGAAADCMTALREHKLVDTIAQSITTRPFLGICMGLQVLFTHSEENSGTDCFDVLPGEVKRFAKPLYDAQGQRLKVPHMGWSKVRLAQQHPLWHGIQDDDYFYFAHSYYCVPRQVRSIVGTCHYGQEFAVAVQGEALFACQFHPEKSADSGMRLLKNFCNWSGAV